VGGAATAWPLCARAADTDKIYRVALVSPVTPVSEMSATGIHVYYVPLLRELERLGYVEGKNLVLLRFSAEGSVSQFPVTARSAIDSGPDVIITLGGIVGPLLAATKTIPVVGILTDPLAQGLVQSLARPGGNITGVSSDAGIAIALISSGRPTGTAATIADEAVRLFGERLHLAPQDILFVFHEVEPNLPRFPAASIRRN
jgi:putative ABC transport system substrate-binding protein